jgi:hypothetical protein
MVCVVLHWVALFQVHKKKKLLCLALLAWPGAGTMWFGLFCLFYCLIKTLALLAWPGVGTMWFGLFCLFYCLIKTTAKFLPSFLKKIVRSFRCKIGLGNGRGR